MTRKCDITGKVALYGNNVPKSLHKTRRRFLPNVQKVSVLSEALNKTFSFCITRHGMRTIEHNGGLDKYLLETQNSKLSEELLSIKKQLLKVVK